MSFILSKILWSFMAPANLFALVLLAGALMARSQNDRVRYRGRRLCLWLAIAVAVAGVLPIGEWAVMPLENMFPPQHPARVDGIILLAGDEDPKLTEAREQPGITTSARRYLAFTALARQYPHARLAFIGGYPEYRSEDGVSNSAVARQMLTDIGISDRISYEDKSRNTFENAEYGMSVIKPQKDQRWLLVTSAYHMPRALLCFRHAGWNIASATTDYYSTGSLAFTPRFAVFEHLVPLHYAMHEYLGIVAYWLMDRIVWPWTVKK